LTLAFDRKLQDDQDVDVDSERNQSLDVPDKLARIISFVVDNIKSSQQNFKIGYDKTHRTSPFKKRDLVMIKIS